MASSKSKMKNPNSWSSISELDTDLKLCDNTVSMILGFLCDVWSFSARSRCPFPGGAEISASLEIELNLRTYSSQTFFREYLEQEDQPQRNGNEILI